MKRCVPDKQETPMTLLARPTLATFGWFGLFAILATIGAARAFDVVPECRTTPARLAFIPVTEVKATTSAGRPRHVVGRP
jgi:hypothetical protein